MGSAQKPLKFIVTRAAEATAIPFKRVFVEQRHYAERYGYVPVENDDPDVTLTCMERNIDVEIDHIIVEYFTDNGQNWQ